jgi:hypothetical protein
MWRILLVVLVAHGLVHLMGFAKAFGLAELPQLTQPMTREIGLIWLVAAVLMIGAAAMMMWWPRYWWLAGALALIVSQAVIVSAWRDAWAGTIVNGVLLLAVVHGFLTQGPGSFRAEFDRQVAERLTSAENAQPITERDLALLPDAIQRYLRATGVVAQPRIQNYRLRFSGRIRSAPDTAWMPFDADQHSFVRDPARLFLMRARMFGVPVEAWHRLVGGHATMKVTLLGAVPMVNASGDSMDRSEAVTMFNDMCLLAPGTLIDPRIRWEPVSARTVRAHFTHFGQTISASLFFDHEGLLTNFESDDRSRASADGRTFTRLRFSTPVSDYRRFGSVRLASHGEARWLLPDGEFTYGEFDIQDVSYNVR